jgi:hypothetical protein
MKNYRLIFLETVKGERGINEKTKTSGSTSPGQEG